MKRLGMSAWKSLKGVFSKDPDGIETEPTQAETEPKTRTKLECAQVRLAFAKIFLSDDSTLNYLPYDVISKIGGFLSYKLLKAVIPVG